MTTPLPLTQFKPLALRYHTQALAAVRGLTAAGGFYPNAYPMPDEPNQELPAGAPIEIKLSVPVGSWIWAFAATSSQAAGFEAQVVDLRQGAPLWGTPANWQNVSGQGTTAGITFPLWILPAPRLVIEPGLLSVKMRNLATVANRVQLVAYVIEPEEVQV